MKVEWFAYIDSYCERVEPGLWSEPLNLVSNLAFIVGPLVLALMAHQRKIPLPQNCRWAGLLSILVGVASASFHSFSNRWAEMLDVGAILIFVLYAIHQWVLQIAKKSSTWLLGFLAFIAILTFSSIKTLNQLPLNGSQGYFGIMAGLLYLGYLDKQRQQPQPYLFWASLIFPISLCLRSIDNSICTLFPWGTHFAWHLLNGIVLSLVTLSLASRQPIQQ